MASSNSQDVTSTTATAVHRAGYLAVALQILACFVPVASGPEKHTLTWFETGLPGEVILALGLVSGWLLYHRHFERAAWCGAASAILAWVVYFELLFQEPKISIYPDTWYGGSPAIGLFICMLAPIVLVALPIVTQRRPAKPSD